MSGSTASHASSWRIGAIVAEREVTSRLRSAAFLISSGVLLLIVIAGVIVGALSTSHAFDSGPTKVAVIGSNELSQAGGLDQAGGLVQVPAADRDAAEQMIRDGDVAAAIEADDDSPTGVTIIAEESAPTSVLIALSRTPKVELLQAPEHDFFVSYLVATFFGIVFFISAMTFGSTIAQSVVEEKQTRVIEILMTTVPTRTLLAGKIVGVTLLAILQVAILFGVGVGGLAATGQMSLLTSLGASLLWYVVFFVFGFVLLASLFAATGAMVSRQEDVGVATTPVMMLIMIPYFITVFLSSSDVVVAVMSYIPFSAPIGMPLRLFAGDAAWWEPLASLALLLAVTAAIVALGAAIYERSLLKMGSRVKWREALVRAD